MENFEIFENACNYFSDNIIKFKDILTEKVATLKDKNWVFDKGSTKVFKADETGRKKRCKVSIGYCLKVEITEADALTTWDEFNRFSRKHMLQILKEFQIMKNWEDMSLLQKIL